MNLKSYILKYKYETLLVALILHLYIGTVLNNMTLYAEVIWPINMIIIGIASVSIFSGKGRIKIFTKNILMLLVILLPILLPFFNDNQLYMQVLNICYMIFFAYISIEVFKFLIKPGYINTDIISAAACGLFLLIEISVFLFQFWAYNDPNAFRGIDYTSSAHIYCDLVYFSSITVTTIGFGDIVPIEHYTKLATALLGVAGQFYSVVLIGILISKFTTQVKTK